MIRGSLEGMTLEQAEDISIAAMVQAFNGQTNTSKRFFKAMRVLNMNRSREIYESLSEEFNRRGVASNYWSELEELYRIADVSIKDHKGLSDQLQAEKAKVELLEMEKELWQTRYSINNGQCEEMLNSSNGSYIHDASRCNQCLLYEKEASIANQIRQLKERGE